MKIDYIGEDLKIIPENAKEGVMVGVLFAYLQRCEVNSELIEFTLYVKTAKGGRNEKDNVL
ncbi:MAG: hypothetical protein WBK67_02040 [Minisyncoccales bacterium]|jgi:hypothetical protein